MLSRLGHVQRPFLSCPVPIVLGYGQVRDFYLLVDQAVWQALECMHDKSIF